MDDGGGLARARRWQQKADELRTAADQMANPFARKSLRRMADTYEALAKDEDERAIRHKESGLTTNA
jgi:hypothetical protein